MRNCEVDLEEGGNFVVTKIFSYVETQTALDEIIETYSRVFLGSVKLSKHKKLY